MPNIKSAKKRVKVLAVKTAQNKAAKTELKTVLKKAEAALATSAPDCADTVKLAVKKLDQAAARGLLHKNNVARKKASLAHRLNAIAAN